MNTETVYSVRCEVGLVMTSTGKVVFVTDKAPASMDLPSSPNPAQPVQNLGDSSSPAGVEVLS